MFNPYAVMYDAKMTVKRWQDVETDGYTKQQAVEVARDRPCRYSSSGQVSAGTPNPFRTAIRSSAGWMRMYGKAIWLKLPCGPEKR